TSMGFDLDDLSADEKEDFLEMVNRTVLERGSVAKILKLLKNKILRIGFTNDTNITSPVYRGSEGAILYPASKKFQLSLDEFFIHEVFHAFQHSVYGDDFLTYGKDMSTGIANPGYINIEFEQIVYNDITRRIESGN